MQPKEKAKELVVSMSFSTYSLKGIEMGEYFTIPQNKFAKQCALKAVDEIINSTPLDPSHVDWDDCGSTHQYWYEAQKKEALKFWQEVKQEIEKL